MAQELYRVLCVAVVLRQRKNENWGWWGRRVEVMNLGLLFRVQGGSKSIYEIAFLHGESIWAFTVFLSLFFLLHFYTLPFTTFFFL